VALTTLTGVLAASRAAGQIAPGQAAALAAAAKQILSGSLVAGLFSEPVAHLVKGALVTMWWKPLKLCCLAVLMAGVAATPFWQGGAAVQGQQPGPSGLGTGYAPIKQDFYGRGAVTPTPLHSTPPVSPYGIYEANWQRGETYSSDDNLPEEAKKLIAEQQAKEEAIRKEAEQRLRAMRSELYSKLRTLQNSYTKAGDLDRAVALRDQARRLELFIAEARNDPGTMSAFRGESGKSFTFSVTGRRNGTIWGDGNVYTDDSDVGVAAVHAGILRPGQQGLVKVTILPGKPAYTGSRRFGVTSQSFGEFPGSYRVERASPSVKHYGDGTDEDRPTESRHETSPDLPNARDPNAAFNQVKPAYTPSGVPINQTPGKMQNVRESGSTDPFGIRTVAPGKSAADPTRDAPAKVPVNNSGILPGSNRPGK
jgi:hypothetical protein